MRVEGAALRVQVRVQGSGFRVHGSRCNVHDSVFGLNFLLQKHFTLVE